MVDVLALIGTRPEAIKMASIMRALADEPVLTSRLCVTGQHRELLAQALDAFGLRADYHLDVMTEDQSPGDVLAAIVAGLGPVLAAERPRWVLVQGDTTSVVAAAIAAHYAGSRVAHVEAGLRTYRSTPFPEEANRRLVSAIADLHFAPTRAARANLIAEGVPPERIYVTGNPVIDALHLALERPYEDRGALAAVPWSKRVLLVTAHRRESWGAPLDEICLALAELAGRRDDVHVLFPTHLNPHVHGPIHARLDGVPRITLTRPLGYLELVHALWRSTLVLTDSGGLQEEAPALGKPVLVLREETERPEGVDVGASRVVGTSSRAIVAAVDELLDHADRYAAMAHAGNPYGDGHAAERIVGHLREVAAEQSPDARQTSLA